MKSQILPAPAYTSWGDYLTKISWIKLKRKCFDTAKRAGRKRSMSAAAKHQVSGLHVWQVMRDAQGRCTHCGSLAVEGRPSDPKNGSPVAWNHVGRRIGSLEHISARGRGGDNEFSNLAWSCLLCNNWITEHARTRGISWCGKPDFGAIYPNLRREPGNKKSDQILAAKYELATGKRWSESDAFAKASRRPQCNVDDSDEEMFPDHECPWDIGMYKDAFGAG